jgi:hypothetical protein
MLHRTGRCVFRSLLHQHNNLNQYRIPQNPQVLLKIFLSKMALSVILQKLVAPSLKSCYHALALSQ